jgi:hypothetical protein
MKNVLTQILRPAAVAVALFVLPAIASAESLSSDAAARRLVLTGSTPVKAAGPYVAIGTYQIQVTAKLGAPFARLPDGGWLYPEFFVNGSEVSGTLLVRFNQGRVSELALLSPAMVTALQAAPKSAPEKTLIVAQARR